ncbi:MAG TPA: hypothetical protein VFT86_08840 [Gaiellaceae bacterium]|nr:hypothetical protein [Gaiellaceae bacterium]
MFAVWALCGAIALAILVTYSRIPPEKLYHVSGEGLPGGLSRMLVSWNWPAALIATVVLGIVVERVRRPLLALLALVLCLLIVVPGVLDQADLDAKWINVLPAVGVLLVLSLSVAAARSGGLGGWGSPRGDRMRIATFVVLTLVSLPWFFAELGFYIPGGVFLASEVHEGAAAVHLGEHHGFVGLQVVAAMLLLSRELPRLRAGWRRTALAAWMSGLIAYGLGNIANDAWGEQVVKRGWTDWGLPSVVRPSANWMWLVVLAVGAAIFVLLRRYLLGSEERV